MVAVLILSVALWFVQMPPLTDPPARVIAFYLVSDVALVIGVVSVTLYVMLGAYAALFGAARWPHRPRHW